eukprot:scaffold52537_cov58-Phaeocystis_antarctica.AAC.2
MQPVIIWITSGGQPLLSSSESEGRGIMLQMTATTSSQLSLPTYGTLRASTSRSPLHGAHAARGRGDSGLLHGVRQAEVTDLGGAELVEQHVGRLEVEVQHRWVEAVEVVDPEGHLTEHLDEQRRLRHRVVVLVQVLVQRAGAHLEEDTHVGGLEAGA